jgi:hypothetical protein
MNSKSKTRFLHRRYLRGRDWGALWAAAPAEGWLAIREFLSQRDR